MRPRKPSARVMLASAIVAARIQMAEEMRMARYWAGVLRRTGDATARLLMRQCRWIASKCRAEWHRLAGRPANPRALWTRCDIPMVVGA